MPQENRPSPSGAPRATIVGLVAIVALDLVYLAWEWLSRPRLSAALVCGRLLVAVVAAVPAVALRAGTSPPAVARRGPFFGLLGAGAFGLAVYGEPDAIILGYVGFMSSVPLMYALLFPQEPYGTPVVGLTLMAGAAPSLLRVGTPWWISSEILAAIATGTATAMFGGYAYRRTLAAEAAAIAALARSERERWRTERLAAVGRLADGVAHDVNSPLASLRSNLRFARDELAAGGVQVAVEALDDAASCTTRIQDIVGSLRAVVQTRIGVARSNSFDAARQAVALAGARQGPSLAVGLDLRGEPVTLDVDHDALIDVLARLMVALAPPDGQVLKVEAASAGSGAHFKVERSGSRPRDEESRLWLPLCQEFARGVGGDLKLETWSGGCRLDLLVPEAGPRPTPPPRV